MKKAVILFIGMMFLIIPLACDSTNNSGSTVPTCGQGALYSDGTTSADQQLFVNWTGPGAPAGPSNDPGFSEGGNPMNVYTWTLEPFGDHVYAGIYNRLNDRRSEIPDTSEGGEIWRYKPGSTVNSGVWEQEVDAGFGKLTNLGIRIMKVYNGNLYAGTHNLDEGAELWRRGPDTDAGKGQWEAISVGGFGRKGTNSVRSMAVFNDKLYLGTANNLSAAKLYKYDDATQKLTMVFAIRENGDEANVVSELVPIGDYLWIFTWGGSLGVCAFRMDSQENIVKLSTESLGTIITSGGIISSAIFNDKIYLGTVNIKMGAGLYAMENPSAADLNDVTLTQLGANVFQISERYLWDMQAFNGQLYIGTFNPVNYRHIQASIENRGATMYRMGPDEGFCQIMGNERIFESGFGRTENFGIRSFAEFNDRLFLGTAQVFKTAPGKNDTPAANRKGTEVWEFDPIN